MGLIYIYIFGLFICSFVFWLEAMINQARQHTKYCLGLAAKKGNGYHHANEDEETIEKMRKEIEASQENALSLCTEKVLLARQAYDLVSFSLGQMPYSWLFLYHFIKCIS